MFAVYAAHADNDDPLSGLRIGERPDPIIPPGWLRIKITHASLNRHDLFTLRGITAHSEGIRFPMVLGNDGTGTLDDGTPVVIYPVMGSDDWRDNETLDPKWHILSEFLDGTFADYVAVPKRNVLRIPEGLSPVEAAVLGTAWLTAYRTLFVKSDLEPGQTLLVQGASGGMSTALIQMGRAAGFEVWVTSRSDRGRELAQKLGAHRTFDSKDGLPHKVNVIVDNIGPASWEHSMNAVARGGRIIVTGATTGLHVTLPILPMLGDQITVCGSIMGTLQNMMDMMSFIINAGIRPEIGAVLPMERAQEAFNAMWMGETNGKTVFTR
jgi:NADPH:quinone reductase-like Zn-dependent oxidoreductase